MVKSEKAKLNLLFPMLPIEGMSDRDMQKRLKNWLEFQLNSLTGEAEREQPLINLKSFIDVISKSELDWPIRAQIWTRIQNSLKLFKEFLFPVKSMTSSKHEQIRKIWETCERHLFKPINDCSNQWATTPALLAVQALLYSHREWTRTFYHDIWSAGDARKLMVLKGIPDCFANKVAILIAFITLFRNGIVEPKEIGVWKNEEFIQQDVEVEDVLGREIFKLWHSEIDWNKQSEIEKNLTPDKTGIILSAIAICALSYEGRYTDYDQDKFFPDYLLEKCQKFLQLYQRITQQKEYKPPEQSILLCGFEFAHYIFANDYASELGKFAKRILTNCDINPSTSTLILSFGRFWSNQELQEFNKLTNYRLGHQWFDKEDPKTLEKLHASFTPKAENIMFAHLRLYPQDRFKLFLPDGNYDYSGDVWSDIHTAIKWIREVRRPWRYEDSDYLPFSAVDRILRVLEKICPQNFITARIIWFQPPIVKGLTVHGYTIVLPSEYAPVQEKIDLYESIQKDINNLENEFKRREEEMDKLDTTYKAAKEEFDKKLKEFNRKIDELYTDARMVVARYAAVAILNQQMAYGFGSLKINFDSEAKVAEAWYNIIKWVEKKNKHDTLKYYLDIISCPFHSELASISKPNVKIETQRENSKKEQGWQALCVDIGATDVKVELWEVDFGNADNKLELKTKIEKPCRYRTAPKNRLYLDGEDFARTLRDAVRKTFGDKLKFDRLIFIGIGWPGPIAGKPGEEYVAGPSGILRNFIGMTTQIPDNQPDKIHQLKIREGFEDVFSDSQHKVMVLLINDGEAHTRASLAQFNNKGKGCKVTLTAGTGTALGVIPSGESTPASILAEVGKFVINLLAPFPEEKANFPKGVANKVFSRDTNPILAKEILRKKSYVICNYEKLWPDPYSNVKKDEKDELSRLFPLEISYLLSGITSESDKPEHDEGLLDRWLHEDLEDLLQQDELKWLIKKLGNIKKFRKDLYKKHLCDFPEISEIAESEIPKKYIDDINKDKLININFLSNKDASFRERFGLVIAHRAGCLLADVAAICIDLFQADGLFCAGGPLSGKTGKLIREFARKELADLYGFDIIKSFDNTSKGSGPHYIRPLEFSSPNEIEGEEKYTGAWGAGSAALDRYLNLLQQAELSGFEDKLRLLSQGESIVITEDAFVCIRPTSKSWEYKMQWHKCMDVVKHLEEHRTRLGLYAGEETPDGEYIYTFIGIPDSVLRH